MNIRLAQFEGPLDLLLYLVQKNEMDIANIKIASITDQYLATLEDMKSRNLDIASEFMVMASTLIYLKSKSLLPNLDEEAQEEFENLKQNLEEKLAEYRKYQDLAKEISHLPWLGRDVFTRPTPPPEVVINQRWAQLDLTDVVTNYQTALLRSRRTLKMVKREYKSIIQRVLEIVPLLKMDPQTELMSLMSADPSRPEMIITFISLLELARLKFIELEQLEPGAPLRVRTVANLEQLDFKLLNGFDADNTENTKATGTILERIESSQISQQAI